MRELDDLFPWKNDIVRTKFIATADENYITARWCFRNAMIIDFCWLSLHAIEKYLKAALLLNERNAKTFGHSIGLLYRAVESLAPELLPSEFQLDRAVTEDQFSFFSEEGVQDYIRRLELYGQAANRYQVNGYAVSSTDLLKIDQLVCRIRPLCQPLEAHFFLANFDERPDIPMLSRRDWIGEGQPDSRDLGLILEQVMRGKRGEELQRVALDWNFPFAPKGHPHPPFPTSWKFENPVLVRRILDPLRSENPKVRENADELWSWLKDNVYLPADFIKEYEAKRASLKAARDVAP